MRITNVDITINPNDPVEYYSGDPTKWPDGLYEGLSPGNAIYQVLKWNNLLLNRTGVGCRWVKLDVVKLTSTYIRKVNTTMRLVVDVEF